MLPQVERLFTAPSRINVRIHCREPPVYSSEEEITGKVVITCDTQVDVSNVSIKLSGVAISRVRSGKLTESHQVCKTSERLFPPTKCAGSFTPRAVTVPPGEHVFSFSIKVPQEAQCHRTSASPCEYKKSHIPCRLPPSTGSTGSANEVRYTLETTVRQDGLIRATKKVTRDISLTTTIPPPPSLTEQAPQSIVKHISSSTDTSTSTQTLLQPSLYTVKAILLNGPHIIQDQPIPLAVEITRLKRSPTSSNPRYYATEATLHDFQSMILETTETRARGVSESNTRSVIVQTMANLRVPFVEGECEESVSDTDPRSERIFTMDQGLWSQHTVPWSLTPSFETCNMVRRYKLEVRLGIRFESGIMRIVEFRFPVQVVKMVGVDSGTGSARTGGSMIETPLTDPDIDVPAPEYREKEAYAKEMEVAGEF